MRRELICVEKGVDSRDAILDEFERQVAAPHPMVTAVTSDLVERAQRGDREAFDALATAAYHRLYAIARGHWEYSAACTLDVRLPGGIPVEEVLFFLVVPVCAVLAFEAVRRVTGWDPGYPTPDDGRGNIAAREEAEP